MLSTDLARPVIVLVRGDAGAAVGVPESVHAQSLDADDIVERRALPVSGRGGPSGAGQQRAARPRRNRRRPASAGLQNTLHR